MMMMVTVYPVEKRTNFYDIFQLILRQMDKEMIKNNKPSRGYR